MYLKPERVINAISFFATASNNNLIFSIKNSKINYTYALRLNPHNIFYLFSFLLEGFRILFRYQEINNTLIFFFQVSFLLTTQFSISIFQKYYPFSFQLIIKFYHELLWFFSISFPQLLHYISFELYTLELFV